MRRSEKPQSDGSTPSSGTTLGCHIPRYLARIGATQVKNKVPKMVCGSQKKTASRVEVFIGLCPHIASEGNDNDKA